MLLHGEQCRVRPARRLQRLLAGQHGAQTGDLDAGRLVFVHQTVIVSAIGRSIEFDQHLTLTHVLAVPHVNGTDHAALQGLDDLGIVIRNDLARRYGNNVHRAAGGPQERRGKHGDDRPGDGSSDRGRRGFFNLDAPQAEIPTPDF